MGTSLFIMFLLGCLVGGGGTLSVTLFLMSSGPKKGALADPEVFQVFQEVVSKKYCTARDIHYLEPKESLKMLQDVGLLKRSHDEHGETVYTPTEKGLWTYIEQTRSRTSR